MDGDHLPYRARRRLHAARAQAGAVDGTLPATLARLREGDRHDREVALFMAVVGRDEAGILAACNAADPPVALRARLAWVAAAGTAPEPVTRLVADAPADTRARLYRRIRARRRTDFAEALIDPVRARFGDAEAAALLPACGEATVTRLLPQLTHVLGDRAALTRRHPRACLEQAARELAALPVAALDPWWARHGAGVLQAAGPLPHDVLDLLERYAPAGSLPAPLRAYGVLVAADPLRVLELLTAPSRAGWLRAATLPAAVLTRLGRLPVAGLTGLARRLRGDGAALARLLRAVPPRDREELFTRAMSDVDRTRSTVDDSVLAVLPAGARVAEARRALRLEAVRQSEARTLWYTAHLPWAEAEEALLAATRQAGAADRAAGWQALIRCAARANDPAAVLAATHHLLRVRDEQDAVRGAAIRCLSGVRPALLRPELVEPLEQIVTDAVRARDSSPATLGRLTELAVLVLRERFDSPVLVRWALHTFQRLLGDDRVPRLGRLDRRLRRGQEAQAFEAVRGWVQLGAERGRYEPLFAVTEALGNRARRLPELQSMLERAIRRGNVADVAGTAVAWWLDDPRRRAERVEAVLREDPSAIALPVVWRAVCAHRDDLLGAALAGPPPAGRFLPAGVRWVPPRARYPHRWLPRHQQAYVDRLAEVVRDRGATPQARAAALRDAAPVPDSGRRLVLQCYGGGDAVLAEAALAALPWTDRPSDALTVLLSHLRDDRTRVAVAGLARASRFLPPAALLAALDPGQGKVTARKAAVRLLVARSVPGAADALWRAWQDPRAHRDVRVAIVAAARQRAGEPGMWRILRAAGASGDRDAVLALLSAGPWPVPATLRADYAALVAAAIGAADRRVAQRAWAALPRWAPWLADVSGAVTARLADLGDRAVWPSVVRALVGLVAADAGEAALVAAVRTLADLDTADLDTAGLDTTVLDAADLLGTADLGTADLGTADLGTADLGTADLGTADLDKGLDTDLDTDLDTAGRGAAVDRAARRRLEALVDGLTAWAARVSPGAPGRRALGAAGRALSTVDGFAPAAATLLLEAADLTDPGGLDEVRALVADRPVLAARLAERLGRRLDGDVEPERTRPIAVALAAGPGHADGMFALAYTTTGGRLGWPAPWRNVVAALRRHPDPDVRDAALAVRLDQ
ncbi:pentapeptide repeat-containing protein [Dactylosporangium aurantiacum]|uniref:pentapeptide repeat-containing protein n=1 Tax=Dactylosporangium aurantiacum TaxID=35754 RepID=UPI0006933F64|nr:pentapeptide repeat-containing protein [Dactylosporangium aurantiacum]